MFTVAIALNPAIWGFLNDFIPPYLLSTASAIAGFFGWITNFVLNTFFLDLIDDANGRWYTFLGLAVIAALSYLYVWFLVPETHGMSQRSSVAHVIGPEKYMQELRRLYEEDGIKYTDIRNEKVRGAVE